jgi:hypothetical protein
VSARKAGNVSKTHHPRGAAAKHRAAIKRGAKADTAKAKASSLVADLLASKPRASRWSFPPQALADIAEVREINSKGEHYISARMLARALKERYKLPAAVETIRLRLSDTSPGGRW